VNVTITPSGDAAVTPAVIQADLFRL
jgi:hypothetical protein